MAMELLAPKNGWRSKRVVAQAGRCSLSNMPCSPWGPPESEDRFEADDQVCRLLRPQDTITRVHGGRRQISGPDISRFVLASEKDKTDLSVSCLCRGAVSYTRKMSRHSRRVFWHDHGATALLFLVVTLFSFGHVLADETSFQRDVQPILVQHCYACHGPDAEAREGDLRLDRLEHELGAIRSGVIVPGSLQTSEFIRRIKSEDEDLRMPPPPHRGLSSQELATLMRWVETGADYEPHWSLTTPVRPKISKAPGLWAKNPVDEFVLARMDSMGLRPSPEASKATLIRRVTLDLTGLPPTPQEVTAFLNDQGADAYERLVDGLIERTAYAERRAQDWLDLARYADSRGFADDQTRSIWPWRDWVISSIHENMPFDQFTIEQLAGDLLPGATQTQKLATGFNRNAPQAKGMTYPVEEYRLKGVIDRVNTLGRVWLGLTLDCAECHDHKFDPITQADYYSLVSIFNNVVHGGQGFAQGGPTMEYSVEVHGDREVDDEIAEITKAIVEAEQKLPAVEPLPSLQTLGHWRGPAVEDDARKYAIDGDLTIAARIRTKQPVADLVSKYDWQGGERSYVFGIGGENDPGSRPGHLFFWVSSEAKNFKGVTVTGSFPVNDGREHHVAVEFTAGKRVRLFVDGIEDIAADVQGEVPAEIAVSNRPLAIGGGYSNSTEALAFQFEGELREVQLSDRALGEHLLLGAAGEEVGGLRLKFGRALKDSTMSRNKVDVPIMQELEEPRETFIHRRGNFLDPGERVDPGVPEIFGVKSDAQPRNRLELARWLVDGTHPLVARVVVNRYWQTYFGQGLVRSADDFGAYGELPSHPELLDWLADEFVRSGWDRKHMHRLIVTSATYRQASVLSADSTSDPENRYLSRMPRLRLPAEQIRDQALAVSGQLSRRMGGPPVFPPQPEDYWQQRALPGQWVESDGDQQFRRSLYVYWRRMALHPTLEILNAPARELCVVKREVSNLPTQALVLMNDPIFHDAASSLAKRLLGQGQKTDQARLEEAFQQVLARGPSDQELSRFQDFVRQQRNLKTKGRDVANKEGEFDSDSSSEPNREEAVWTLVCAVLLNLDETLTRP